jgi:hypothetical protein
MTFIFIFKECCKCIFKKEKALKLTRKKIFFVGILKVFDEKSRITVGSASQRYGSEDPDPYQNVTDPEH